MYMTLQFIGSFLVLLAYFMSVQGYWNPESRVYLWTNAVASVASGVSALYFEVWGFVLLGVAWFLIALHGLWKGHIRGKVRVQDTT